MASLTPYPLKRSSTPRWFWRLQQSKSNSANFATHLSRASSIWAIPLTELTFVERQAASGSVDSHNQAPLHNPQKEKIDALLNIQVQKVGLHGIYSIDPPTDTFVQVHVELIRLKDDTILLDEHFTCTSDEKRTYQDWADQGGSDVIHDSGIVCRN